MTHRLVRYDFGERLMHTLAALAYLYLLLTGLAFWTPAFYWIAVVLGGGYLSRVLHPWIGLLFAATVLWMFVVWRRDMRVTPEDRTWRRAIRHYIRNEDDKVPPAWRFNFGQKQLFWLMVFGAAALLLTGIVMWLVASIPGELSAVGQIATLLHAVAALATIAGFIIHVYMGVAVVPGGLDAVIHGEVTEEWARRHHPLWLAQVKSENDARSRE
ncbi:MAG: formate dehydrogenase subunit gamma [Acidobacteria bacterium]|nr:formate dehydrogenase subunit gamma [Acidobacteriota bacterium]MBI3261889.1 formate dehydrogenase subunit gamma [Acidobacteriota bacterium]